MSSPSPLSRDHRLLRPAEFKRVFREGRRLHQGALSLVFCGNDLTTPRLGLAIAKRNARLAVDRNRVKRIVRESFRHRAAALPTVDCVVLLNAGAPGVTRTSLRQSADALWQRLINRYVDPCDASSSC